MSRPVPFVHPVTVRYLEVDRQGVVFNMWYLAYLDDAMTAFLGAGGLSYGNMLASGWDAMVVHTELDWHGPLGFGDQAEVHVAVAAIGRTSFTLRFDVLSSGRLVANASTVYVAVRTDGSGKCEHPSSAPRRARAGDVGRRPVTSRRRGRHRPRAAGRGCAGPSQPVRRRRSSGDRLSRNAHATSSAASSELAATDSTPARHRARTGVHRSISVTSPAT